MVHARFTYAFGFASAHVVRQATDIARIAHEDGRLDHSGGGARELS